MVPVSENLHHDFAQSEEKDGTLLQINFLGSLSVAVTILQVKTLNGVSKAASLQRGARFAR